MDQYITQCKLECNGQEITDFKKVTEGEVVLSKAVPLMGKTGISNQTPRYTVTLDYVVPADKPPFNFYSVKNGTIVIEYEGGQRVTYTGATRLKIGETVIDGDNESTRSIEFAADARTEE